MMNTATVLEQIKNRGILLTIASEGIRYKAKPGTMTSELKEAIREHRAEIAAELQSDVVARQRWGMPPHKEFSLAEHAPRLSEEEIRLVVEAITQQPPDVMGWALDQANRYEDAYHWPSAVCDIAGALDVLLWQQQRILQGQTHEDRIRELLESLHGIEDASAFFKKHGTGAKSKGHRKE